MIEITSKTRILEGIKQTVKFIIQRVTKFVKTVSLSACKDNQYTVRQRCPNGWVFLGKLN